MEVDLIPIWTKTSRSKQDEVSLLPAANLNAKNITNAFFKFMYIFFE